MGLILEIVLISIIGIINSAVFSSAFFGNYDQYCSNFYCGRMNSTPPFVRYPFKFLNQSQEQCGYPGFELGCDSGQNITVNLPSSGEFYVENIDYYNQGIQLRDPQGCLPGRLLKLLSNSSNSSPFSPFSTGDYYNNYTFLACRNQSLNTKWKSDLPIIGCLSNSDVFIMASSSSGFAANMPSLCDLIGTVAVPGFHGGADDISAADFTLSLSWKDPVCFDCVARGGFCRFAGITICTVDDTVSSRWKGWEKVLKIVGLSVFLPLTILPVFFFIVLLCFGREERRRNFAGNSRGLTFSEMIRQLTVKPGLEDYVIDSYPKMVVDERLGNVVDDVICCICLGEYVAGEILRSLPECKHYFHIECIDEWLKINRTCPVCRV